MSQGGGGAGQQPERAWRAQRRSVRCAGRRRVARRQPGHQMHAACPAPTAPFARFCCPELHVRMRLQAPLFGTWRKKNTSKAPQDGIQAGTCQWLRRSSLSGGSSLAYRLPGKRAPAEVCRQSEELGLEPAAEHPGGSGRGAASCSGVHWRAVRTRPPGPATHSQIRIDQALHARELGVRLVGGAVGRHRARPATAGRRGERAQALAA